MHFDCQEVFASQIEALDELKTKRHDLLDLLWSYLRSRAKGIEFKWIENLDSSLHIENISNAKIV